MERVVQFDTKRKTSPGLDMSKFYSLETGEIRKEIDTDAAWLSSARGVSCTLKWENERNPRCMLNIHTEQLRFVGEEDEDDVKSARFLRPGLHTHYNGEKQRVASWQQQANLSNFASVRIEGCNLPS